MLVTVCTLAFSLIGFLFSQRGTSLLSEIPEARTCAQADIEPHWCACLCWTKMDVGDEKVKKAATALLTTINSHAHRPTLSRTSAHV